MKTDHFDSRRFAALAYRLVPPVLLVVYLAIYAWSIVASLKPEKRHFIEGDFIAFWVASSIARSGDPAAAYDPQSMISAEQALFPAAHLALPWQYPPTFLLLVVPLSLLPLLCAYVAFMGATSAGYCAAMRKVGLPPGGWAAVLAFPGLFVNLSDGQNGLLLTGLMGAALLLMQSRPYWAGIAVGLLCIKPHLALLIPAALLCARRWSTFWVAALTTAALILASAALLGMDTWSAFFERMKGMASWIARDGDTLQLQWSRMPTLFASARLWGASVELAYRLQGLTALCSAAAVVWVWIKVRDAQLRSAALVSGTLLISPYLFDYDLALLALPIAWLGNYGLRNGWLPFERLGLALVWFLPLLVGPAYRVLHLQLAPFVLWAFFWLILRRCRRQLQMPSQGFDAVAGSQ